MGTSGEAQFFKKLAKKAEKAAERTVERRVEKETTKKTDQALDSILEPGSGGKQTPGNENIPNGEGSTTSGSPISNGTLWPTEALPFLIWEQPFLRILPWNSTLR